MPKPKVISKRVDPPKPMASKGPPKRSSLKRPKRKGSSSGGARAV